MNVTLAEVRVDLGNTSCVITDAEHQYGQWAPGVTRRVADEVIAADGWRFVPGSTWTTTVDGGTRPVFRADDDHHTERVLMDADDLLLDELGGRLGELADEPGDELHALLVGLCRYADRPAPELVSTDEAAHAIAVGRLRRFRRVQLSVATAVGAVGVPLVSLLGGGPVEIALAFPVGALSYLGVYGLLERLFGGAR